MKPAAWRVGAFALAGLALLALAVALLGGRWFAGTERGVLLFERSVFGLQVGAPVVLRGVRVGQVTAVGLVPAGPQGLVMPVTVEFDRTRLRSLLGNPPPTEGAALPALVAHGLVARLATQSLLTGLLYVDLDLDPARAAALAAPAAAGGSGSPGTAAATPRSAGAGPAASPTGVMAATGGLPTIPTEATRLQTLQSQLEGLDLAQIGRDLAAVAASSRQLLAGPEAAQVLERSASAALALQQLADGLQRRMVPLLQSAEATLADTRRAVQPLAAAGPQLAAAASQVGAAAAQIGSAATQVGAQVGTASAQVGTAAARVGDAAVQAQGLAAAGVPALAEVQRMGAEVARAAAALREASAEDSALRLNADRALQDVARAARSLRELSDLLERHPDAVLRGRGDAP